LRRKIGNDEFSIRKQVKGVCRKRYHHATSDGRADRIRELLRDFTSFRELTILRKGIPKIEQVFRYFAFWTPLWLFEAFFHGFWYSVWVFRKYLWCKLHRSANSNLCV
jgi:hypothetical protein